MNMTSLEVELKQLALGERIPLRAYKNYYLKEAFMCSCRLEYLPASQELSDK